MPQQAGRFVPQIWANPRPPFFGESAAVVAPVTGGDGRHIFKRQPEPGARAWALLPAFPQMAYSLQGPGYIVQDRFSSQIMPGPQLAWTGTQIRSGINGQVYSGAYQQGLMDPMAYYAAAAAQGS